MITTLFCLVPVSSAALPLAASPMDWDLASDYACSTTAHLAARAGHHEVRDALLLKLGNCVNISDGGQQSSCVEEAWEEYRAGIEDNQLKLRARLDVCNLLGEEAYDPVVDPQDFVPDVTHRYFPLVRGTTWLYEGHTELGFEEVQTEVLDETKMIAGIECTVVRTVELIDGELHEDTVDWYAQDKAGNVWYFGERSFNFSNGEPTDFEGSWQTGTDHAKAGIVMRAEPQVGDAYRQEFLLGEAEDVAVVLSLSQSVTVPFGSFDNCIRTSDFSPLDNVEDEEKVYAEGIGLVFDYETSTGLGIHLVDMKRP